MGCQIGRNITVGNQCSGTFIFYELRFQRIFTDGVFICSRHVIHAFQICRVKNKLCADSPGSDGNHLCSTDRAVLFPVGQCIKCDLSMGKIIKHLIISCLRFSFSLVGRNVYAFRFNNLGIRSSGISSERFICHGKGLFSFSLEEPNSFAFR